MALWLKETGVPFGQWIVKAPAAAFTRSLNSIVTVESHRDVRCEICRRGAGDRRRGIDWVAVGGDREVVDGERVVVARVIDIPPSQPDFLPVATVIAASLTWPCDWPPHFRRACRRVATNRDR